MTISPFLHFSTRLKRRASDEQRAKSFDSLDPVKPVVGSELDLLNVVIIEDEEAHFLLMERAIQRELPLASVHHFDNASACLEDLAEIAPDVIVVDYLMPGMNGIEFLTALDRMGRDIPVVMITGQGDESIAVRAIKLGAYDYLVKSAGFFMLLPSIIARAIREKKLRLFVHEGARLNALLLDSLPYPAMLINRDRITLAVNRIAEELGARVGYPCWKSSYHCCCWGKEGSPGVTDRVCPTEQGGEDSCIFCLVKNAFETERATNSPDVEAFGRLWDMWCIPIDAGTCLHYAIDITQRKKAELGLRASKEQLRLLSARLLATQEEERKRISRELHDSIGSSLSAIKIYLENALDQMEKGRASPESLKAIISMTQDTITESRRIMTDLRPSILDDLGIVATLGWLCRRFKTVHTDIDVEERLDVWEGDVPEPLKIVILRIAQEAFHNIAKYSRAREVTLSLCKRDDAIQLTIRDDGVGFDVLAANTKKDLNGGIGLTSMKERAKLSGGALSVTSSEGEGTTVSATWLLAGAERPPEDASPPPTPDPPD